MNKKRCFNYFDIVALMQKFLFSFLLLVVIQFNIIAQLSFLPLEHYYRDRVFGGAKFEDTLSQRTYETKNFGAFFPVLESQSYRLSHLEKNRERNTWLGRKLFNEHFFEYSNEEFFITMDFLGDVSLGKDFRDSLNKRYFYNSRGVQVSGGIGKYFGFFSNLRENQARFLDYQVKELRKGGPINVNSQGNMGQGGAFVSGANRTKPFKVDAFDFAYVTGGLIFQPHKKVTMTFGNNPLFIGAGHRSLFYSDHSNMFTHLRIQFELTDWFNAQVVYGQQFNNIRMSLFTPGTERLSEKKGYTLKYLNFTPFKSLQISLFEGTSWLRYDNDNIGRVHPLFYNPISFINPAVLNLQGERSHTILGAQLIFNPVNCLHLYSQIASNDLKTRDQALQLGLRLSEPFKIRDLHFLIEANRIPESSYRHANPRLNYINNNVSLAHPIGTGVDEILMRVSYEWKRIGINVQSNAIKTVQNTQNGVNGISLAPITTNNNIVYQESIIGFGQVDLFYRFNRKSNAQVFTTFIYRQERVSGKTNETVYFGIGMRTALSNRYFDL